MGKGSKRRRQSISEDELDRNWDMVFRRDGRNAQKIRRKPMKKEECSRT